MDDYVVHDEHGKPLTMSDVPSVRLLRGRDGRAAAACTPSTGAPASRAGSG